MSDIPEGIYVRDEASPEPFIAPSRFDSPGRVNSDGWPTYQQWATFAGGEDPDNAAHMELHDDPDEGMEQMQWLVGGGFAHRTVAYGPWTVSHPAGDPTPSVTADASRPIRGSGRPPDPRYGAIPPEGRFIEPTKRKADHQCPLPQQWTPGTLWQCPEGHLWVVGEACECGGDFDRHNGRGTHTMGYAWQPATWSQRRRYGGKRADLSMADLNVRQELGIKPSRPPQGESGVSLGPDGRR
jgi:hypothetical protein